MKSTGVKILLMLVLSAMLPGAGAGPGTLIHIGSRKQLFLDDYLIQSLVNTKRVLNPAVKVRNNPVLRPDQPWEGNDVRISYVIYDRKDRTYKMWYSGRTFKARRGDKEIAVEGEDKSNICLATSKDGIHWEKPALGLVDFHGSRKNNMIPADQFMPYFFEDTHDPDPAKRYKGLIRKGSTQTPGMTFDLYYSPDAFHWTPYPRNPIIDTSPKVGRWGPTNFLGWDPIRRVYVAHLENCLHKRCPLGKRLIGRAESTDMVHWGEPETILVPDQMDSPDTEFYAMPAFTCEEFYVGLLWIFRTTNTTHHPELVVSRDGIHYNRDYREPFIPRGAGAEFDSASLYVDTPIQVGDQTFFYYSGVNWRSPETLLELGDKAVCAIGLAVSPPDGFVSLDGAKSDFSQATTRPLSFSGTRLHLNVRSALQQWGAGPCEVRVEIMGPDHLRLPGYALEDADPITGSAQAHMVSWRGNPDVSSLAGKPVIVRFHFKNAKLYSFQFR